MNHLKLIMIPFCTCIFLFSFNQNVMAQKNTMNMKKMQKIFEKESTIIEGDAGSWQLLFSNRILFVLTDEEHNRMRIFTPVLEITDIEDNHLFKMLEANFHSALDAKYSLYNNFVVSVYTHPLKELSNTQVVDALKQVVNLADTFGTSYSSTDYIFGSTVNEEKHHNQKPGNDNERNN